jgi:elongation factor G
VKEYAPENIRNVAIAGHQECGKTILAESLLFTAGAISRLGKIDDGNTTMDCTPDEIEKKISIQSAAAFCEHKDTKINFLDTPGYEDFVGDVLGSLSVVESVIIPVRSDVGVEVGTEKIWELSKERGLSTMLVVTKLDKEHSDFDRCVNQARESFGGVVKVFQLPIGQGDNLTGVVDLVSNKAYEFSKDEKGTVKEIEIPADLKDRADRLRKELMETAAESDEARMEKYLETENLDDDEFRSGISAGLVSGDVCPVFCVSSVLNVGAGLILDGIVDFLPSPAAAVKIVGEDKEIKSDPSGPPAAFVFKNSSDSHVGDMLFLRAYSGVLTAGDDIYNVTRDHSERLGQLYAVQGKHREDVSRLPAGDLGAVVKLKATKIGDTLTRKGSGIKFSPTVLPRPSIFAAISSATKGDEDKMGIGLARLHDEDPAFEVKVDPEIKQTLISGQGEMHLEVVVGRLRARFGVEVILDKPRIPYKETIKKHGEAQGKYKKQTGGRGQFGDVHIRLDPQPHGEGFEFVDAIVGGVVPGKFIPAVEKGIVATMASGVIAGYPFVDVKATLYDGSYHTVDSSENAFRMAGSMAFKKAVEVAGPALLEPIVNVRVKVPEEFLGDVMGDLSGRRGKIQGMEPQGKFNVVNAQVPLAELYRYSTHLRSMTQGRGTHSREFSHYEEVPREAMQKIIDEARKKKEEEKK